MQKFVDYVDRFFNGKKKNRSYSISTEDCIALIGEIRSADGNGLFRIILILFNYGYVKGYRACMAETKKAGVAYAE